MYINDKIILRGSLDVESQTSVYIPSKIKITYAFNGSRKILVW